MTRTRAAIWIQLAFAILLVFCAVARPSMWRAATVARVLVLLEAGGAVYIARGLASARPWAWRGAFALGLLSMIELWYASAAFVFSYMGEGMPDHAGLLLLMGSFALQLVVLLLCVIQWLSHPRRAT